MIRISQRSMFAERLLNDAHFVEPSLSRWCHTHGQFHDSIPSTKIFRESELREREKEVSVRYLSLKFIFTFKSRNIFAMKSSTATRKLQKDDTLFLTNGTMTTRRHDFTRLPRDAMVSSNDFHWLTNSVSQGYYHSDAARLWRSFHAGDERAVHIARFLSRVRGDSLEIRKNECQWRREKICGRTLQFDRGVLSFQFFDRFSLLLIFAFDIADEFRRRFEYMSTRSLKYIVGAVFSGKDIHHGEYLFSLQRWDDIAQVTETSLDMIAPFPLQSVVMGSFFGLIRSTVSTPGAHVHILTVDIVHTYARTIQMIVELIEIQI